MRGLTKEIFEKLKAASLVDTHEHLLEEKTRLRGESSEHPECCQRDFSVFFSHYLKDDLLVSGLRAEDLSRFFCADVSPKDKWKLIARAHSLSQNTGYMQCARESLRLLFHIEDFSSDTVDAISESVKSHVKPGFYKKIIRETANVELCQVHTREDPLFCTTQDPELLRQDLIVTPLVFPTRINPSARDELLTRAGLEPGSLSDWKKLIDWCFAEYAKAAVAIKYHGTYLRALDFQDTTEAEANTAFGAHLRGEELGSAATKAIEDYLFRYILEKVSECKLPLKVHTGYSAHTDTMRLRDVKQNLSQLTELVRDYPSIKFVLLHIAYPYSHEVLALTKHYTNVYADLSYTWMVNPVFTTQFLRQFLLSVPCHKACLFGGDLKVVELLPGHAELARRGTALAIASLVEEGWLPDAQVDAIIESLARGNAKQLYHI